MVQISGIISVTWFLDSFSITPFGSLLTVYITFQKAWNC